MVSDTCGVNPALIPSLPFDTRKDLVSLVLATFAGSEYKTFADRVAAARAKKSVGYCTICIGSKHDALYGCRGGGGVGGGLGPSSDLVGRRQADGR